MKNNRKLNERTNAVIETLNGFDGEACLSNMIVGIMSRGYEKAKAQSALTEAMDYGLVQLDERAYVIFRKD